jgi:hypothetical protein
VIAHAPGVRISQRPSVTGMPQYNLKKLYVHCATKG